MRKLAICFVVLMTIGCATDRPPAKLRAIINMPIVRASLEKGQEIDWESCFSQALDLSAGKLLIAVRDCCAIHHLNPECAEWCRHHASMAFKRNWTGGFINEGPKAEFDYWRREVEYCDLLKNLRISGKFTIALSETEIQCRLSSAMTAKLFPH